MLQEILTKLNEHQIHTAQLDPFGFCNGKCYYCPVKYYGNPRGSQVHMPRELLEKILDNLADERGGLLTDNFDLVYTGHYNEVILYKGFRVLLSILRDHGMKTIILTNGVALDKDKQEAISEYSEAVYGICFNIPSVVPEQWSEMTGFDIARFPDLLRNVKHTRSLKEEGVYISIQVNDKWPGRGQRNLAVMKEEFPFINVYGSFGLVDRAGLLIPHGLSNELQIPLEGEVFDCSNSHLPGGRQYGWLHINPRGRAFLCCNDFYMEHYFGDFNNQELSDFWRTEEHAKVIKGAFGTICRRCVQGLRR